MCNDFNNDNEKEKMYSKRNDLLVLCGNDNSIANGEMSRSNGEIEQQWPNNVEEGLNQ